VSNSKAYSGRDVNRVSLDSVLQGREGRDVWAGVDVGKYQVQVVLNWGPGDFGRPWKVDNPHQTGVLVGLLGRLAEGRKLVLAMEPSGTYGDVLRQACTDAGLVVHRVSPKAAHDYAEVFDGVPSQHDGKDAGVVAELARLGKSAPWPWAVPSERRRQIEYGVDRMDAQRRLGQMYGGRLEAGLARHWPEVLRQLKLTSPTLLKAVAEWGGPAALAADPEAAAKLKRWGRAPLADDAVARIVEGAKHSVGVRPQATDVQGLRDHAAAALAARKEQAQARKHLAALSAGDRAIEALAAVVGTATACVLVTHLGDPADYHCGAAYVKAMGLNLVERSSGTYQGRLKISKRGSAAVRFWMYLAALRLVKKDAPARPWYLRKKGRGGDGAAGRALVGIMRRLALALYNVGAKGEAFDPKRLFPGKGGKAGTAGKGGRRRATTYATAKSAKPKEAKAVRAGANAGAGAQAGAGAGGANQGKV
jgi:transposase